MFAEGAEPQPGGGAMRCESCGVQPASVHVAKVEEGKIVTSDLCQSCAAELGREVAGSALVFAVPLGVGQVLGGLLGGDQPQAPVEVDEGLDTVCGVCGTTAADVREHGLLEQAFPGSLVALRGDRTVAGSLKQPLGTDSAGHDNYSRIIFGTRWALYVGVGAVLISTSLALIVGLTSGYFLGNSDAFAKAVASWSKSYADQAERDFDALEQAVKSGRLPAESGI